MKAISNLMKMDNEYINLLSTCCICLNESSNSTKLYENDSNNTKLITKLRNCVGELDWVDDYVICNSCLKQLNIANDFQQLCFRTYQARQKIITDEFDRRANIQKKSVTSNLHKRCQNYDTEETILITNKDVQLNIDGNYGQDEVDSVTFDCEKNTYSKDCDSEDVNNVMEGNNMKEVEKDCDATLLKKDSIENSLDVHVFNDDNMKSENDDSGNDCDSNKCDNISSEHEFQTSESRRRNKSKRLVNPQQDLTVTNKSTRQRRKSNFTCDICSTLFDTSTKLVKHSIIHHKMNKKDIKPFVCLNCPSKFTNSSNLNQHMKYHIGNKKHICSYCGRGFVTYSDLRIHEKQHLNKREYNCPSCPKNFNTHKDLRSHKLVVHTDPSLWSHCCPVCNKRFPIKSNFDTHMRRHNNEKPFSCHLCEKKFSDKCVLERHLKSHTNIRPYKCSECDREYKDRRVMEIHMVKKHSLGNVKVPERVKKHFCHICPKSYFAKNKLTRHLYTHSGERPFVCNVCSKKFTDNSYLKQHLKNTHNVKDKNSE